jgi:tetratricopeptide (TPR) repeat protein
MSLLLEALKKAEKAKEEAQRRAQGQPSAGAGPAASPELRLQETSAAAPKHVVTRAELPDISQPLEILSDDITPKSRGSARPQAAARETSEQAGRASAKKVFEAKFKEPNPRLPFQLTMAALGVAALCIVGYFWYQLRPPSASMMVNATPSPAAAAPAATASPRASAPAPSSALAQSIPGLPGSSGSPGTPAVPRAPAQPPVAPAPFAQDSQFVKPAPALRPASPAMIQRDAEPSPPRAAPQINPRVGSGYAAYLAGNIDGARADYEQPLRDDPANRDALLGLAAVDVRSGRLEAAEATYLRLLRADPRDSHAQAGLIALRGGRMDPLLAESRLKTLLATDPGAHVLNFALGNQLAQQGRWAEAQQQYFKAFAADPENADFAYNLAVSLDHLRQPKLALEYYQRALALAAKRGASFDVAAARMRVSQLGN